MGTILQKKIKPYLLVLLLCMSACSKNNGPDPSQADPTGNNGALPKTGSSSGIISPAGAVTSISFLLVGTSKSYTCIPDKNSGSFNLEILPEGNYKVDFVPDAHYNTIPFIYAVVAAGKNTDLGTLTTKEATFRLSYEINGIFEGRNFKAFYSGGNFDIGPEIISTYPEDQKTFYYITISLNGVTAPGTYTCKGSTRSQITYSGVGLGSGVRISYQSTEYAGGEGTVNITSIDPGTRTIKGTFIATLTSASGKAGDTKIVTNGMINASY